MNKSELKIQLEVAGIRPDAYSLDGAIADECLVLEQQAPSVWVVYYSERGQQTGRTDFPSEELACAHIFRLLLRDKQYQEMQKSDNQ